MSNVFDKAYEELKKRIIDNIYKPSQRLVESHLTKELNVSRNTVREILYRLEKDKLIVIERNKGAYIKSLDLEEVLNILEIRELIEQLIARSAVDHMSDKDFEKMEKVLREMKASLKAENFDEYSRNNKRFHEIIYNASKKPEAVELVKTFKTQLVRHQFRTVLVGNRSLKSFEEHKNIFKALQSGDKVAVEQAIGIHIRNVAKTIEDYYQFFI